MTVSFRHGSGETLFVLVLCSTASRTVIAQCSSKVPMQLDSKVVFSALLFFLARRATIGGTLVVWQKRLCNMFGTHTQENEW